MWDARFFLSLLPSAWRSQTCPASLKRQLHSLPRRLPTTLGRFARGIELIVFDLRSERLPIRGNGDPFDEDAPTRGTPATTLRDLVECRGRLGHVELVLGLELVVTDLTPDPVRRRYRREGVVVRRLGHGPALVERIHELEVFDRGEGTAGELALRPPLPGPIRRGSLACGPRLRTACHREQDNRRQQQNRSHAHNTPPS